MELHTAILESITTNFEFGPAQIGMLVGLCVLLTSLLIIFALQSRQAIGRRLASPVAIETPAHASGRDRRSIHDTGERKIASLLARAGRFVAPTSKNEISAMRRQLVQAGFFSQAALPIYYALRILLAVILPLSIVFCYNILPFELPGFLIFMATAGAAVAGLIIPGVLLDWRIASLRQRYRQAFPDMMDLLVVCIESGHSLHAAIERVGKEIMLACPELGANIHLLCLELRAGRSLSDCLAGLHERVGIDEVKSLRLLLKQSEELGASIATTLRVYSEEMRDKRLMRAETKAHALPVKLTLPLGMFIFPVILLVIMVPLVIRIKSALL